MQTYTLADVIRTFNKSDYATAKEFFYYNTPAKFSDMAAACAQAVLDGREIAIFEHDHMTIAHLGGGTYLVNEASSGASDSAAFDSDSHDEARLDAAEAWRG